MQKKQTESNKRESLPKQKLQDLKLKDSLLKNKQDSRQKLQLKQKPQTQRRRPPRQISEDAAEGHGRDVNVGGPALTPPLHREDCDPDPDNRSWRLQSRSRQT